MQRRDFSLRVPGRESGEIGVLIDAFNDMLAEIGRRSHALQEANTTLEHEMDVRQHAEEALRVADRRKSEFLATLAHELRNPLAPIRTGLDLLRMERPVNANPADPAARQRVHAMMDRQLGHLIHLVDDLLDIARITRGKIELKKEPVTVDAIVRTALETSGALIDSHGHTLLVELPSEPLELEADVTRMVQVLSNLLNNAAKYTPRGGRITLSCRRED